jgi:hypothetical protein
MDIGPMLVQDRVYDYRWVTGWFRSAMAEIHAEFEALGDESRLGSLFVLGCFPRDALVSLISESARHRRFCAHAAPGGPTLAHARGRWPTERLFEGGTQ